MYGCMPLECRCTAQSMALLTERLNSAAGDLSGLHSVVFAGWFLRMLCWRFAKSAANGSGFSRTGAFVQSVGTRVRQRTEGRCSGVGFRLPQIHRILRTSRILLAEVS